MNESNFERSAIDEIYAERDEAVRNLGIVAAYLCSVNEQHTEACIANSMTPELSDAANNAGHNYNMAIERMLNINARLRFAEGRC